MGKPANQQRAAGGQATRSEAQTAGTRGSKKDALRGRTYEEQQAALTPPTEGNLLVLATTGSCATADDQSGFSPALAAKLEGKPLADQQQQLAAEQGFVLPSGEQLATTARRGPLQQSGQAAAGRFAAYVGNQHYHTPGNDLQNPIKETLAMAGAMGSKGFQTMGLELDATAAEMRQSYRSAAQKAQAGDSLFLFYSGHGTAAGLLGVETSGDKQAANMAQAYDEHTKAGQDYLARLEQLQATNDVLPTTEFIGLADEARGRGARVTVMADSCFAGAIADAARASHLQDLLQAGGNGKLLGLTIQLQAIKRELVSLFQTGTARLTLTTRQITGGETNMLKLQPHIQLAVQAAQKQIVQEVLPKIKAQYVAAEAVRVLFEQETGVPVDPIVDHPDPGVPIDQIDDLLNLLLECLEQDRTLGRIAPH